jgi:hypothetical protein
VRSLPKPQNDTSIMSKQHPKSLFDLVVPAESVHPSFKTLRTMEGSCCARGMLDNIYQSFEDPDGNFVEQFQTTGFDARFFELYLFAYFSRSGYEIDRSHPNPDFLITRDGLTVAVEATTVNPPTSGVLKDYGKTIADLSPQEMREYMRNELPIRFGSPLFSKLSKRYWDLPHCRAKPFVLAIEAFHDSDALGRPDNALMAYAFGITTTGSWDDDGILNIATAEIEEHSLGPKTIPSNFFAQPDAEHVSAIVFTNSGTQAKFSRMGYHHGIDCDEVEITRWGFCYTPDLNAIDPTFFSYNLDEPPLVESWGQGLVVMHNPRCHHPLPRDFFVDAIPAYVDDGQIATEHRSWHPYTSKTVTRHFGGAKAELAKYFPPRTPYVSVSPISCEEFRRVCGNVECGGPSRQEAGWFTDASLSFLGVLVHDVKDDDWGYIVLARDQCHQFRAIGDNFVMSSRDEAREELQIRIAKLLSVPQRFFPQEKGT